MAVADQAKEQDPERDREAGRPRGVIGWLQSLVVGYPERPPETWLGYRGMLFWGLMLIVLGIALFSALVNLWPAVDRPEPAAAESRDVNLLWGAVTLSLTKSSGLVVLAILAGAIGGYIHATTSFAGYAGARNLKTAWMFWYALRLLLGAALGLIVYVALRAGLLGGGSAAQIDPYGTAAFAGLVGIFSKEVLDKLKDVVKTLFGTAPGGEDRYAREERAAKSGPGRARRERPDDRGA